MCGKGGMCGKGVCMVGVVRARGACVARGRAWQGCAWQGGYVCRKTATEVGGMDPKGIHSC